ncbi:YbaK/EbsC family protein [Georgenia faecalis]|uniref:YbaK/EbsC family protein n=1 Tax=Georgenia faecalis TaxID=2483799 RepID=UPI000FDAC861|nr:YbaK/EbsC family protein [Georgenia faecalis]
MSAAPEPTPVPGEPGALAFGTLTWVPALGRADLLADPVAAALGRLAEVDAEAAQQILVAEIDPALADTAAMTEAYELPLAASANCVLVAGKRAGDERVAACVVRATTRADVNNVVRRLLDVRKASFWPMDQAVTASGMEYGAITPVGVPTSWRLLLDTRVTSGPAIVGSGVRHSKLLLPGEVLARLEGAEVITGLGVDVG